MSKCTVEGNIVTACEALEKATEFGNPRGKQKGIWCWQYFKASEEAPTRRFWGAKSGDSVERGIAFNYCPFCGTEIAPESKKDQA